MTPLSRAVSVVIVALAAGVSHAGWWDEAGAARRTTVAEIRKDPDRWRDVTIVVDVKFAQLAEPGNPYFTRFSAKEWRAVAAFAAEASRESMETTEPFALFFVRRGTDHDGRLDAISKGRRVQLRGTVRDVVKGEPWIEVFDVVADGDPLTPEEDAVLARGGVLLARDNPAAAEALLRGLAAKRAMPRAVQADVWRKIGAACHAQRRLAEAVEAYTAALAAVPEDVATAEKLSAARAALAASPKSVSSDILASRPASVGTRDVPLPRVQPRRMLPPGGLPPTPPETPAPETSTPERTVADAPRPAPVPESPPAETPVDTPAPVDEPPTPPPPPKPKLLGPR